jgi:2-polyprenyl-3-methyl-5-hydroxy-6-metoxy-1,4-benzoquinol methylase
MSNYTFQNSFEVYDVTDREEMLGFVPESAKTLLDVGCSVGNFGSLVKEKLGAEVWGVEADAQAADVASGRLDFVVNAFFGNNSEFESKKFDCIVFNDVLEHMVDPYSALSYARELLSVNGRVVASIPNVRYFANLWKLAVHGSWEYEDTGILDRTHLRFFTKKSIESMFISLGYEIDVLCGINALSWEHQQTKKWLRYLILLLGKRMEDTNWMQFAVVARPSRQALNGP